MFRGSSFHTIDAKGRIIIPARFKDVIKADGGEGLMITRMDSCLLGFMFSEWRKIEAKILDVAEKSDNMRRFRRVFIGSASECGCDTQGRILIPPRLREHANLEGKAVIAGTLDKIEIWNTERYEEDISGTLEHLEEIQVSVDQSPAA